MAHVTYDIMWREAIMDLLDQLEAENPEDQALAPREFSEWACIYIRYLQIFRKLEAAYDQMVHPQKLVDMKRALEACMGRMLEIRHWLVKLNRGSDFLNIDDILVDLKLTPDELEIPVPRYFRLDNQKALDTRDIFLEQLIKNFNPKRIEKPTRLDSGSALPVDEAVAILQRNERGRQARQVARVKLINKKQRQLADRRNRTGIALTHEMAVTKIQSALRGMLWRRRIRAQADAELVFIGMKPAAASDEREPQAQEARNSARRKLLQAENRRELERDVEALKSKVQETEGLDMRETVQDKINAWFVENRHPETGEYPDFPDVDEGGSKVILNPPPPPPEPDPAAEAAAAKGGKAPAGDKGKGAKGKGGKGDAKGDVEGPPEEVIPSVFVPAIERAVQEFVAKWQDRDESMNFAQRYDPDLVKDELRPLVFEETRLQVDEEMRTLLENLKDMVDAEKAAKSGKKVKKKKKKKKKKGGKKGKKGKKKKDLTADRALEHLYVEMVSNGILQQPLKAKLSDYVGSAHFNAAALERSGMPPDGSMAHVRQALTEYAALPLGSGHVHERLEPHIKAVLLYGQHDTGKKLLAHAVAHTTGANFFNLSPRNTDSKYQKKAVAMMLHIVFKVAKTMAPSVIFIDEVEKVFLSDKKKLKEFSSVEPYNRIKKELAKVQEMKQLKPGERVLVIGASSEPQLCAKKDEKALLGFFQKHICLPAPDYASRKLLLPGLVARHGGAVDPDFDWPTLAQITEGYTSGQLDQVVASILTERRLARLAVPSSANKLQMSEFINWLAKLQPASQEAQDGLRKFTEATPARVARRAAAGGGVGGEGKGGGKKGGKKKKK